MDQRPIIEECSCEKNTRWKSWHLDHCGGPLDDVCAQTLYEFYSCSSGLTKECAFVPPDEGTSQEVTEHISKRAEFVKACRTIHQYTKSLVPYGFPNLGRIKNVGIYLPQNGKDYQSGDDCKQSSCVWSPWRLYPSRDRLHSVGNHLFRFSKNVTSYVSYLMTSDNSPGKP